jgi:tetrapyrrole methylase family protein / MazG family protein
MLLDHIKTEESFQLFRVSFIMTDNNRVHQELNKLIFLIKKLRAPDGCPWDREQKPEDIGKYILEEAYEVVESLEAQDYSAISEELGDLLFQILFLAEMGNESNKLSLDNVIAGIKEKMIRRHPHVFGNVKADTIEQVKENWQQIKNREHCIKNNGENIFSSIPRSLPALRRAQKITAVASAYGFDWQKTTDVIKKLKEELTEFNAALKKNDHIKIEEELGDLLFTLVNLSRFVKVDSETALSKTTNKFLLRFIYVTDQLSIQGKSLEEASMEEMDALWNEAKLQGI